MIRHPGHVSLGIFLLVKHFVYSVQVTWPHTEFLNVDLQHGLGEGMVSIHTFGEGATECWSALNGLDRQHGGPLVPMNLLLYFTLNIYQRHDSKGFQLKNHFTALVWCSGHQQINNSCSQKDGREAKSSLIYMWQILISLKINVRTVSAPLCLVACGTLGWL